MRAASIEPEPAVVEAGPAPHAAAAAAAAFLLTRGPCLAGALRGALRCAAGLGLG